jgi:prepilin-type N-terminal cleavage/methylation domain-containing protein
MKTVWRRRQRRAQSGFTLVEVAVVLALLGILASMAFKSQEVVEQYRQGQFLNSVRMLQSNLSAYRSTYGRWPGDCNRDGLLDTVFVNVSELGSEVYDYTSPSSLSAASSVSVAYSAGMLCPASSLAPFAKINVPFNELKWGGHMPAGEPNRKAASHALGGSAFVGTFNINPAASNIEDRFNAIVLTAVPIAAARRLAVAIDGQDGSAANLHRVRRSDDLFTFEPLWTASGETDAKRITVVIFFDRIPPLS